MDGWQFDEANPIATFTVAVELSGPIPPQVVREIVSKHHLFKRELPRRIEQPLFMFPFPSMATRPQENQIAVVSFDRVGADGSVAQSLLVGPSQIAYMTASYTRWKEFQPVLERLIGEVLKLVSGILNVTAFVLTVVNKFRWHGSISEAILKSLLNPLSSFFASNMLDTSEHRHSFHGYLERRAAEPPGDYIRNINIQTADEGGSQRLATVLLGHRLVLTSPIRDLDTLFNSPDFNLSVGSTVTTELHDRNNEMFRNIINSAVVSRIPGL